MLFVMNIQITQSENNVLQSQNQKENSWLGIENQFINWDYEHLKNNPFEYLKEANNVKEIRNFTIKEMVKIGLYLEIPNEMIAIYMMIADIETGGQFNPVKLSKIKSDGWSGGGIFQLTNTHTKTHSRCNNICSGDDRHNIYKAIPAVVKRISHSMRIIENKMGRFEPHWVYTRIHNSGLAGICPNSNNKWAALVRKSQKKTEYWMQQINKVVDDILFEQNIQNIKQLMEDMRIKDMSDVIYIDNTYVNVNMKPLKRFYHIFL